VLFTQISAETAVLEGKLKKQRDLALAEDKRVNDLNTKISTAQGEIKRVQEALANKQAALVSANQAMKGL
jgi:uncharacterized small protein (DUF1192 family)